MEDAMGRKGNVNKGPCLRWKENSIPTSFPFQVPLWSLYEALELEGQEGLPGGLPRASQPNTGIARRSVKKEEQV